LDGNFKRFVDRQH